MINDFEHAYTCAGYGFLDGDLLAAYFLKYVQTNDTHVGSTWKVAHMMRRNLSVQCSENCIQDMPTFLLL